MKLLTLVALLTLTAIQAGAQNQYTATYTAGDIQSDISFTSLPGASTCPASLTVNVPMGETIDSAVVNYTYFSSLAGFGSPSMQRSQIRCTTTGQAETQLAVAVNPGMTTASYQRTLTLANGLSTGPVTFAMHAGNTGILGSPCTSLHVINNNTWTITVYTTGGSTGLATTEAEDPTMWLNAAGELQLAGLSNAPASVRVLDAMGRLVLVSTVNLENGSGTLALPNGTTGVLIVLVDQDGVRTERRLAAL